MFGRKKGEPVKRGSEPERRTPDTGHRRKARVAPPAFLFFGVFTGYPELLDEAKALIVREFGPLHPAGSSAVFPFPRTQTYEKSMGASLVRQFFVLDELRPQDCLAGAKRAALVMEERLAASKRFDVPRPVNIDPGLLNDCRLILASTKDYAHRLYRADGIWEEITLIFRHGSFETLPWTYPDFRAPTYHEFFARLRRELLERLGMGKKPDDLTS